MVNEKDGESIEVTLRLPKNVHSLYERFSALLERDPKDVMVEELTVCAESIVDSLCGLEGASERHIRAAYGFPQRN